MICMILYKNHTHLAVETPWSKLMSMSIALRKKWKSKEGGIIDLFLRIALNQEATNSKHEFTA